MRKPSAQQTHTHAERGLLKQPKNSKKNKKTPKKNLFKIRKKFIIIFAHLLSFWVWFFFFFSVVGIRNNVLLILLLCVCVCVCTSFFNSSSSSTQLYEKMFVLGEPMPQEPPFLNSRYVYLLKFQFRMVFFFSAIYFYCGAGLLAERFQKIHLTFIMHIHKQELHGLKESHRRV